MSDAGSRPASPDEADRHVRRLARFFAEHPAWVAAAERISDGANSKVFFRHRPGEEWHLLRREGQSELRPGPAPDPDFAFRFTPGSIERLAAVEGGIPDFAIELFTLVTEADAEERVDLRIVAPFRRLARRGYLRLLLESGPRVAAWGARRGVTGLRELRRVVSEMRTGTQDWERTG